MSRSTCWLSRVERRGAGMFWRAGGSHLRHSLQLLTTVAARSAGAISSCPHARLMNATACARKNVATSHRVQSDGVGLPTDSSEARSAGRLCTVPVAGLARGPGRVHPNHCSAVE
eukprot:1072013-Pyramimonas_sp.AAC.1